MSTPKFNNIKQRMQYEAEQIIPGVKLSVLLRGGSSARRTAQEVTQLQTLMRSGNCYMNTQFFSAYYGAIESTLKDIAQRKVKKVSQYE